MKDKSYIIVKKRMGFFGFLDSFVVTLLKVICFIFFVSVVGMFFFLV